ncbi:hypothetical protein LK994_13915 [Ferruginibacter lapsinanis]|uniref:hypothetical protein n=1 Tax=Ferruginibacter lapsinanis TaxID=563172 RepID=UPI001E50DFE4|nr:hypothetical protein [Ferruginibacter lapsinanis]UEG49734.1 hypothetical protein LK994_13915 [Ferruginibacter lapsinanis]
MAIFEYPFYDKGVTLSPHVPIIITNPIENISIAVYALLDTGADDSVFTNYIADATWHNLKGDGVQNSITQGVGAGHVETWKHTFTITLLSPNKNTKIWRSENSLISCVDHDLMPPILGFTEFLSKFKITFDYNCNKIIIEIPDDQLINEPY